MEKTTLQKAIRNEYVWLASVGVFFWFFVTTVVLPLKTLQIQIAQVQSDLTAQNKKYDALDKKANDLTNRTSVLESRLDNLRPR